jgi:hypothetical protein
MATEQEHLQDLLQDFSEDYPQLAEHINVPTVDAPSTHARIQARVTQGTTTTASGLTYLGPSTG